RYAMRLWLDRERLAAYALTVQDVEEALRRRNVEIPGGRIESRWREFTVLAETDLRSPEEFDTLVIKQVNGYPVKLKDIGRAELGAKDERNIVRVNGQPAVGLGVVKQAAANTLAVARAVKTLLPEIQTTLPDGMRLQIAFDASLFIEKSIIEVYETLGVALALVLAVTFLFLRSLRATVIPSVTIPVSLIGAFIFLLVLGFSVNILTVLALTLAIGLVVDDAIVMLENIHRRIEGGMHPKAAALEGSREIAFAVVAMTLTLATVFTPLAFMTGNTGRLFREFALAVSSAVLVSGFVALTLTPMMCSRMLRVEARHGRLYTVSERALQSLTGGYRRLLAATFRARWLVVLLGIGAAGASYVLFSGLKSELAPVEDRGTLLGIISAPEGATLAYTDRYARELEAIYARVPEIRTYFMVINPVNFAISFVSLKPWEQRSRSQQAISQALTPRLLGVSGVLAFPVNPPSLGQSFRDPPVQFVVQGASYAELQRIVDQLMAKARAF
ncbi:MAG: efflux RND transporter permease subunit, partial [Gammaproteobacteria bacterium]